MIAVLVFFQSGSSWVKCRLLLAQGTSKVMAMDLYKEKLSVYSIRIETA